MDQQLAQGKLGEVGQYDVAVHGSKLVAKLNAGVPEVSGNMEVQVDLTKVIDAIAAAIPGKMDDLIFAMLKKALGV
jgi:hypothetical protein